MKKGFEKESTSGASLPKVKRFAKIFLINNHSDQLEDFEERLARIVESGECKKILAVKLKPTQSFDDPRLVSQIIEGIEKARKQIEGMWRSFKGYLETDIWAQWMLNIGESTDNPEKTEPKEHEKPTSKRTSRGSKNFTKEQAKNKRAPDALDNSVSELSEEVHHPSLIPRLIPSADMNVLLDELRSRDLLIPDYYILVLCKTPTAVIKDLLRHDVAIAAVIHFIPCSVSELEAQLPAVHEDMQEIKKCPETKHIGVFTSTLHIEPLAEAHPTEIYKQFKSYLFDLEMLSQHFLIYQSEFLEINDALTSKESLIRSFQVQSSKQSSDITAVCVYFDNLCRMVETHSANERRYSSFHPRPFLDNDYNKVIIEDANDLLKSAIATQMNLVSYWKAVDIVINAIRQNPTDSHCSVEHIKLPLFKELLSWESFAQRLEMVKGEYDHCCRKDLSDKFKLFVFRRTFHKILETTKKYHLPTRLCFRDFCSYLAPRYVAVLRRHSESFSLPAQESDQEDDDSTNDTYSVLSQITEDGQGGETYFSGLTFDDTFQELTVVEKVYRFHRSGCIRVRLENWMYKEPKLTVEISLFQCVIFAHRWGEHLPTLFPRVRLISKNGITCNVEMTENPAQPYISIQWPNDCQIRYICENGVGAVEQRYFWATTGEYKRVFTNRGCVLVYLRNGDINVLTPNGIFYQLYPESPDEVKDCQPLAATDISTELNFVRRLTSYGIDCKCFDVTKNDGRKIRVLNGVAIEERARYLVYEWMDLGFGEMFAERDDGVKLISSYWGLKTYYPCGTVIHTTTEEEYIELDIDCRSPSTENILRKINPDIIRRLEEKPIQRELWLSFNLTYHVRHERYANITCYEETKMIIQSPDHVKVIVTGDSVVIDVGDNLSLRFTPDLCTITSSYDNDMSIKLNLIPNDDEMLSYQSANAKVTLKETGQLLSDEDFIPIEPYDEELYFLTKQYKFGIAFIPECEFNDILKKYKKSPFFYESATKIVILKNVLPLNDRFSMPIPDMDSNLDKLFITKCRRKPREHYQTEHVFSVRTIIKLDSIPKDLCDFLRCYSYIEMTLSENIQEALYYWFAVKQVKQKCSPAWKEKIKETREAMRRNKECAPIYHAMVQYKVFPKYHEFVEAGRDVNNVNLKKLIPMLARKGFQVFRNCN